MCKRCLVMSVLFVAATLVALFIVVRSAAGQAPAVVMNEIAWMGTTASANDEWIELYNPRATAVDLAGWTLSAEDGSPTITLAGTIAAGGYFLLERTDDTSVTGVAADMLYTGSLANDGELLRLADASGAPVDSVREWLAGDNETKQTMARVDDGTWKNGIAGGTPKAANAFALLATATTPPKLTSAQTPSPPAQTNIQDAVAVVETINASAQKQSTPVAAAQQSAVSNNVLIVLGITALASALAGIAVTYLRSRHPWTRST